MVIDSSAIIAVLLNETNAAHIAQAIESSSQRLLSAANLASPAALDDEIASLDPPEPPHRLVEPAARERLPGDNETDMGGLWRLLRNGAPAGGRGRRAEE
jgi:hypothetical protein